jgi:NAD(P)-dependent dehydrogenase (short-subunit alcohol dehydrogenase family)
LRLRAAACRERECHDLPIPSGSSLLAQPQKRDDLPINAAVAGVTDRHNRRRTILGVNVLPEDIAGAVLHFASSARSGKSTRSVLNVDGGIAAAYPR